MERLAGRVILLWGWPRRIAAFLGGALATLALPPFDFPAGCFIAFPVLVWLIDGQASTNGPVARALPAFAAGWWFGFGYFLASFWWVGAFLLEEAGPFWVVPLAVFGLPALLALFYGFAAFVARLLWSDGIGRIAALAFGFGLAEWLRSAVLFGLSWNAIGYAAMPVPVLMQIADAIGIIGASALAVFVFSTPALIGTRLHAMTGLAAAALFVLLQVSYGYFRLSAEPAPERFLAVRIVQPAAEAETDFDQRFRSYLDLSAAPPAEGMDRPQLVLWPELAVPFVLAERPSLLDTMSALAGAERTLIAGAMREEGGSETEGRLYNAVVAVTGEGIVDASDKIHLLPLLDTPFFTLLPRTQDPLPADSFSSGGGRRLFSLDEGVTVLPLVGTEISIPGIAESETPQASLIVNPARQSAFPTVPGPDQHLRQAQIRAVEAGLPMLIALPAGPSAAIDAHGRILDALDINAHGFLDVNLPLTKSNTRQWWSTTLFGLLLSGIFGMFALSIVMATLISDRRN